MTNTITLPRSVVEQALEDLEMTINYVQSPTRREDMRDSIEALRAALEQPQDHHEQHLDMVPAGWKLVPVDPTRDMLTTWIKAPVVSNTTAPGLYRAILAAAPQPPVVEQQSDSDMVSVPRSLLGAACAGMRHRLQDAPKVLEQLRRYTVGDLSKSAMEQPQSVTDCHQSQPQVEQESVAHSIVAGALFDFMGWLTSRDDRLVLSSTDDAVPAVEVITAFAKMRGLSLDEAMVRSWQDSLMQQPKREPLTDEQIDKIADGMPGGLDGFMKGWGWRQFARTVEAHGIRGEA